jgi:hypothetical protein
MNEVGLAVSLILLCTHMSLKLKSHILCFRLHMWWHSQLSSGGYLKLKVCSFHIYKIVAKYLV